MKIIDRPYIKRVSFLGGECLAEQNLDGVLDLIKEIRISFPKKTIWLCSAAKTGDDLISSYTEEGEEKYHI